MTKVAIVNGYFLSMQRLHSNTNTAMYVARDFNISLQVRQILLNPSIQEFYLVLLLLGFVSHKHGKMSLYELRFLSFFATFNNFAYSYLMQQTVDLRARQGSVLTQTWLSIFRHQLFVINFKMSLYELSVLPIFANICQFSQNKYFYDVMFPVSSYVTDRSQIICKQNWSTILLLHT